MRTDNRSLVFATLGGLFTVMSCTLIADVDRTKIQPPPGPSDGGQGASGGSSGTGGKGGTAGKGGSGGAGTGGTAGTSGSGGDSGEAGQGGVPSTGGSSGTAGSTATGGTAGTSVAAGGAGGEAGAGPAICGNGIVETGETCDDGNTASCGTCSADCLGVRSIPTLMDASLTIGNGTNFADGDTVTINDGTDTAVLEFDCNPVGDCAGATAGVASGNVAVTFNATNFDGMDDATEYRDLLIAAIDGAGLATDASDGGSAPAMVSLTAVETLSDTVGAPSFVAAVRCRATRGCTGDSVCLSLSCTAAECD